MEKTYGVRGRRIRALARLEEEVKQTRDYLTRVVTKSWDEKEKQNSLDHHNKRLSRMESEIVTLKSRI